MCFIFFADRTLVHCNTSSGICVYLELRLMLCLSMKESYRKRLDECTCCLAVLIGSGVSVDRR